MTTPATSAIAIVTAFMSLTSHWSKPGSTQEMRQKRNRKQGQKNVENELGNTGGSSGNPAKAQHRSDQRDDKKSKRPAQHDTSGLKRRTYKSRFLGSN